MVLVALTTEDTASTERMRQIPRFARNDEIFGAGKTDPFGQRTRGFRTAGSQRELPEHVDVETLRAKTALRMTRTG